MIGLFGQLVPHKGGLAFVEAARRALLAEPGLRFVLAGAGTPRFVRRLRQAIDRSGFAERFHLLQPQPTGTELIQAADVVCMTTTTPDPLPRVVLEAMAMDRPVVGFAAGGTVEMVKSGVTGCLLPPGDLEGLARAMVRLARDPATREAMGQAGGRRARGHFSLGRHLDEMERVFRSVAR
jgi:glycosyltransferase involved in cell wall biosynthesis